MTLRAAMLCFSLLLCALAAAEPSSPAAADPDFLQLKRGFEFGNFRQVLDGANGRIDRGELTDPELVELHRYGGLAAFNINRQDQAEHHFEALLRLEPEASLDPFSVPPPAIKLFERIRLRLAPELRQIREERRLRSERLRQDEEERALSQRESALARQRLEELSRRTVQRVDHHAIAPNFLPFGVGQFVEGRNTLGTAFAVSEAVLAVTSIASFWIYQLGILNSNQSYNLPGNLPPNQITVSGVPASRSREASFWSSLKTYSGVGFYVVYASGVADALVHYREETVTTIVQEPTTGLQQPRPHLFLTPGGGGVSLSARF